MTARSSTPMSGSPRQAAHEARPARRSKPAFAGELISTKLHSVGLQAAVTILLSIVGLGSAMGQSLAQDAALGANTQATRDRVVSEIRQARADGTISRWSPVLLELPGNAPQKGRRFEPFPRQQRDGAATPPSPEPAFEAAEPKGTSASAAE